MAAIVDYPHITVVPIEMAYHVNYFKLHSILFILFLFLYPDFRAMSPLNLYFIAWDEEFFDLWTMVEIGFFR